MKRLYLLCSFFLMEMAIAFGHASVFIDFNTPAAYRISFQGAYYTFNGNSFNFDEFDAGVQQITVERFIGNNYVPIYNGIMRFEENVRTYARLDDYGRLNVYQKEPLVVVINPPVTINQPHCGTPPPTLSHGCTQAPPPPPFANESDYQALIKRLEGAWYDDDRRVIVINALRYQNYSAEQVRGMLKKFWYEDSKLAVAKEAFKYSTDKANFFKINDVFWYSASIQDFNEYMLNFQG